MNFNAQKCCFDTSNQDNLVDSKSQEDVKKVMALTMDQYIVYHSVIGQSSFPSMRHQTLSGLLLSLLAFVLQHDVARN